MISIFIKIDFKIIYRLLFFYLISMSSDELEQAYINGDYDTFIKILPNFLEDDVYTGVVGYWTEHINTFILDKLLNDDNVDEWFKFKFFCTIESQEQVDEYHVYTDYSLRLLCRKKDIYIRYINYILNITRMNGFITRFKDKFLTYLLERMDKDEFNRILFLICETKSYYLNISEFILEQYYKHPYFNYDRFNSRSNNKLLGLFECHRLEEKYVDDLLEFLKMAISSHSIDTYDNIYCLSCIFDGNLQKITKNNKYIPIFVYLTDIFVGLGYMYVPYTHTNSNIHSRIAKSIQHMLDNNYIFYVSKNFYDAICNSERYYFSKEEDEKIKNMYIRQQNNVLMRVKKYFP